MVRTNNEDIKYRRMWSNHHDRCLNSISLLALNLDPVEAKPKQEQARYLWTNLVDNEPAKSYMTICRRSTYCRYM